MMSLPASAQLPESALDHMLQNPIGKKRYENKRFGDHLFVEGGAGARAILSSRPHPGLQGTVAIGDWQTPEHGWRLGVSGGRLWSGDNWMTTAGLSADYLLNFTALSATGNYEERKRFEVYGVAGLDVLASNYSSKRRTGLGVHAGLRGTLNIAPLTYFYVEPQLGMVQERYLLTSSFHGYRFAGSLQAGFGYNLLHAPFRSTDTFEQGGFLDNTFVTLFAGPSVFLFDNEVSMLDSRGARFGLGFGKLFDSYNGLRLAAYVGTTKQGASSSLGLFGAQADYLLNLHSLFGGEKAERRFWLNAVAGAGLHVSSNKLTKPLASVGGGVQANVRLNERMALFVEPRVDAYQGDYAPNIHSTASLDVAGSVMAGLTLYRGVGAFERDPDAQPFDRKPWYNNLFFEAGGGLNIIGHGAALQSPADYIGSAGMLGLGTWLSPSSGVRLWLGFGGIVPPEYKSSVGYLAVGADYLWNITNTIKGYNPDRRRELIATAGLTLAHVKGTPEKYTSGLKVSLRRQWNLNKLLGIYVEPELKAYGKKYFPGGDSRIGADLQGSLLAGVQLKMYTPEPGTYLDAWEENGTPGYFSAAAGPAIQAIGKDEQMSPGYFARFSYVKPVSPLNAWRFNLTAYYNQRKDRLERYSLGTLGVDYMTDFTARAFGYDPDRRLSVKGFVGVGVGTDYSGSKNRLTAEGSAGMQLSVNAGEHINIFAEPQVAWSLSGAFTSMRERVRPAFLVGVDYLLKRQATKAAAEPREKKNAVSAAVGPGLYTGTVRGEEGLKKITFATDFNYSRWLTPTGGVRFGAAFTSGKHSLYPTVKLKSFHADYMFDVRSVILGGSTQDDPFQMTGYVGVNVTAAKYKKGGRRVAPGLQSSLQLGWKVMPELEIFAEPSLSIYAKRIDYMPYPAEGEARLLFGTKYSF